MKKEKEIIKIIAQSCGSTQCKQKYKKNIIKNFCEAITTPHKIDLSIRKRECLICGKKSNF